MIRDLPFYNDFTSAQKEIFDKSVNTIDYAKGQMVHTHDGHCLGMLYVVSGKICISMMSDEGREIVLFRLGPGEVCVLSASCVLRQIAFEVHIEAEIDTKAQILPSHVLLQLINENQSLESYVYKLATEHFSDVMWTMQQILFCGFDSRLASYLYDEMISTGSSELKVTHEQIAKHTASAREVVTRMLKRFADDGIVTVGRGSVTVTDAKALKKLIK